MSEARPLEARGIWKGYGRREVLRGLDFAVAGPEVVGIIGPNGAGKTTLLRILLGLIRPDNGSVRYGGDPPPRAFRHHPVAFFGGEATLPPSVRAMRWATLLQSHADIDGERRRLGTLSRGTRQGIGLKVALGLPNVGLIVLDEPWEGLDPDASRWLTRVLHERRDDGAAVIVSSHRLADLAGLCDRYAFLMSGVLTNCSALEVGRGGDVSLESLLEMYDRLRRDSS